MTTSEDLKINGAYAYNHKGLSFLLNRSNPLLTPTMIILLKINENDVDTIYIRKNGAELKTLPIDEIFSHLDNELLEFVELIPTKIIKQIKKTCCKN